MDTYHRRRDARLLEGALRVLSRDVIGIGLAGSSGRRSAAG